MKQTSLATEQETEAKEAAWRAIGT